MLEDDGQKLGTTFYSDEMGIRLFDAQPKKAWGETCKKIKMEKPLHDIKLSCWGAISRRGSTSLHIFKGNLNGPLYETILQEHTQEMQELYPSGFWFQHDNLPVHQCVEDWMADNGLERVSFPSYSPDLTPIENLWATLKHSVRCDAPLSEGDLRQSLTRNWKILTSKKNLKPYFDSLSHRYQECIDEDGERLPY